MIDVFNFIGSILSWGVFVLIMFLLLRGALQFIVWGIDHLFDYLEARNKN